MGIREAGIREQVDADDDRGDRDDADDGGPEAAHQSAFRCSTSTVFR